DGHEITLRVEGPEIGVPLIVLPGYAPEPLCISRTSTSKSGGLHYRRTSALRITHSAHCHNGLLFVVDTVERDPHQTRVQALLGHPERAFAAVRRESRDGRYTYLAVALF